MLLWRAAHSVSGQSSCGMSVNSGKYTEGLTAHHGNVNLPQRLSLRSWVPCAVFAMLPLDATGGWQVAAGWSGPW